jgi:hypothetical protein
VKRDPEPPLQKRGRGNPNMQLQRAGYSINPGGRRKHDKGAKELMGEVTVEMVEFWIATVRDTSEEMCHRMRASENIAWGFLGKPSQQVIAAHAHLDLSDLPKDAPELDNLAAAYAAMLGAVDDPSPVMIDVTPSRSRALSSPQRNGGMKRSLEDLQERLDGLADEEPVPEPQRRVRRPRRPR